MTLNYRRMCQAQARPEATPAPQAAAGTLWHSGLTRPTRRRHPEAVHRLETNFQPYHQCDPRFFQAADRESLDGDLRLLCNRGLRLCTALCRWWPCPVVLKLAVVVITTHGRLQNVPMHGSTLVGISAHAARSGSVQP